MLGNDLPRNNANGVGSTKRRKLNHAELKERLGKEIRLLESEVALLTTRNLPAHLVVEGDPILRPLALELAALQYTRQAHQLHVAKMQSALSRGLIDQPYFPLYSRICLTKDWNERRSTLQRMRDQKLRRAYEFVMSTSHLTNSGAVSLQQVFDGLSFFMVNMEIIISEELGHVMLRDDYDTIEDEAFHSRFVSTDKRGIIVEGNAISFRHLFSGNDNGYITEPCGVAIVDCVDDDELYPYRSSERVRRDSSGAIVLTARKMRTSSASGYEEEMVVTMRRATFLKIRRPEFPLSEPALQELHDDMMQWTDVMVKSIRSIVYQKQ
ncbi:uncharacterized protein IUM83_06588 [Phytophthora cinnamomi]|uniref:uncharacterized protein n=1 Tax=Phytophthora cinnamomi TaxID=4785 RepID=UPI0035595FAD|nr:hypothetical protein IUM83_06588 [Phytophthora cinnamomi]